MEFPTNFSFEIAIPSFDRSHILPLKTLKMLEEFKVPKHKIRIFLKDAEQYDKYILSCGEEYQYEITGQSGILATRNYLQIYYHETSKLDGVLFIDDDITAFLEMGKPLKEDQNFISLIEYFFIETRMLKGRLWAVNALNNPFYMSDSISTTLKYCIGAFKGLILDRTKDVILTDIDHFEDHLFSCEYFLEDGVVVRFNKYGISTKYFELVGGICGQMGGMEARQAAMDLNGDYMVDRYPGMCSLKHKKFGTDLRLNFRYKVI